MKNSHDVKLSRHNKFYVLDNYHDMYNTRISPEQIILNISSDIQALRFTPSDPLHLSFLIAGANLYAAMMGVPRCEDKDAVKAMAEGKKRETRKTYIIEKYRFESITCHICVRL